ncbi:hybrid sensor histidine kinase/response regulator [Desulfonema magnum]|uniref:histidine kinase n=1 Tax=Desulfonema magnum TaxID=45655 RepID=A0A975BND9_9BACT|nr:hybrid sensor histidine kinase/response regulator [Desulfonema magnum]QTA88688.1 Two component system response regulator/histidine kinase [Desulfonema magnum]
MNLKKSVSEEKPFILIVDDVPKNLQIIGNILSSEGYLFTPATNGNQALKIIEKRHPDLILLDIMMPEMDGYEVCKILKNSPRTKDIPVIFLTARTETEDIVRGFESGGVDYITKPFNSTELLARIKTHLEILSISNERKELLHVLCHDLANPFASIVSALEIIKDYDTFKRLKKYLSTAAGNGLKVIDLVRKIRALEDKKINLELEPVNLKKAIDESLLMLEQKFAEKHIEIIKNIDPALIVCTEKISLLNSVINNLFTNAIKFSFPDSKIIIGASQADDMVTISIRDFGVGMSQELQKDIFDMKKTTSRIGTGGEVGTGFGMPLVKKFVHTYGGKIEIFSKEEKDDPQDHGTEIRLTLKAGNANVSSEN